MHWLLDEVFLTHLEQAIEIQHISKDDEEEQKELDLQKQYLRFPKDAQELLNQLEGIQAEKKTDKIEENLNTFQTRNLEWN